MDATRGEQVARCKRSCTARTPHVRQRIDTPTRTPRFIREVVTRRDKNHQRNLVGSRVGCKHCTHKLPPRGSWRMPAHWRRRFMTHWRPRMTACSLIGMRRVRAKVWIHERSCDGVLPVLIVSVHRWLCRQGSGSANPQAGTVATERWPEWPPCAGLCVRDRHAINWSCAARLPGHCH